MQQRTPSKQMKKTKQLLENYFNANAHLVPLENQKIFEDEITENTDLRCCRIVGKPGLSWKIIWQIYSIGYHKSQDDALKEFEEVKNGTD